MELSPNNYFMDISSPHTTLPFSVVMRFLKYCSSISGLLMSPKTQAKILIKEPINLKEQIEDIAFLTERFGMKTRVRESRFSSDKTISLKMSTVSMLEENKRNLGETLFNLTDSMFKTLGVWLQKYHGRTSTTPLFVSDDLAASASTFGFTKWIRAIAFDEKDVVDVAAICVAFESIQYWNPDPVLIVDHSIKKMNRAYLVNSKKKDIPKEFERYYSKRATKDFRILSHPVSEVGTSGTDKRTADT